MTKPRKSNYLIIFWIALAAVLVAGACRRRASENEIAIAVALTQTAAATSQQPTSMPLPTATLTPSLTPAPVVSAPLATKSPAPQPVAVVQLPAAFYFIDRGGQIMRLEQDGVSLTQITNEAAPITDYDISPDGQRIVYVSGNMLIETNAQGASRIVKVAGEQLAPDDHKARISREILAPHFSPDGKQIAYGLNGVNLISAGAATSANTEIQVIQPSDPHPDLPGASAARPEKPARFFRPLAWSPDGTRLLLLFAYYPEGSGLAIKNLGDGSLVDITTLDGFPCCNPIWSRDSQSIFVIDQSWGYPAAGLWRIDARTGGGIKLVSGGPELGQTASVQVSSPYQTGDGSLLAFVSRITDPAELPQFIMHRIVPEDVGVKLAAVRNDVYNAAEDVIWAKEGSGALLVNVTNQEEFPFNGQLFWLPANGDPAIPLAASGRMPRWGSVTLSATPLTKPVILSPEAAQLEELAAANLGLEQVANAAQFGAIDGVRAFQLEGVQERNLWAVHTYGMRSFDPEQNHTVAIYARSGDHWEELARLELAGNTASENFEPGPDFIGQEGMQQVFVEPGRIWLQVEGGVGAHSGVYHLLNFDGASLRIEVAGFSSSPGAGSLVDLDGDSILEVLLDATEYYVFCYACGVRLVQFNILRWDGARMAPVALSPMPDSSPADLRNVNERMIRLAEAGLWKDATALLDQVQISNATDPTFIWNAIYIRLNAQSKQAVLNDETVGYPLLDYIFYGDYTVAVDILRDYRVEKLFTQPSPLVVGTVAEGWEEALADWIIRSAERALQLRPGLAPAYFLRAWATFLVDAENEAVLEDVTQAAALAPDDTLYVNSVAFLGSDISALPAPTGSDSLAAPTTAASAPESSGELIALTTLNVRAGPGIEFPIIGSLAANDKTPVTGRLAADKEPWWQIVYPPGSNEHGWVSGDPTLSTVSKAENAPVVEAPSAPPAESKPLAGVGSIFYSATDADGRDNIYVLRAVAGAEPALLVQDAVQPSLQPNGQRLAFRSTRSDALGLGGFDLDSELRVRFSANIEDSLPSWNPEGNRLVFASNREGDRRWRLYVTWADDNFDATVLGFGQDPAWHPNEERIVFKGCDETGARCGLWAMASDGAQRAPLTDITSDSRPQWSSDGSYVVFMSNERDGNWELYRVAATGGAVIRLTNHPANDGLPAIHPNGSQIAFLSDRNGAWALWVMPAGGGTTQRLAPASSHLPNWLEQGLHWAR